MEHSTEILYNKTEVFCSAAHRFGSDALLLARFTEPKRSQKAMDLCSGCGIVSLEWHDRGHRGECAAVELQPEASSLLREALAAQGIDHITPVCADLRTYRAGEGSFDVCACNPPYFTAGFHRPERLAEVLAVLRANRLEPKRLAFVKNKPDAAPWLFLVEAQKNRKTGLRIQPDVLISVGAALYGNN